MAAQSSETPESIRADACRLVYRGLDHRIVIRTGATLTRPGASAVALRLLELLGLDLGSLLPAADVVVPTREPGQLVVADLPDLPDLPADLPEIPDVPPEPVGPDEFSLLDLDTE